MKRMVVVGLAAIFDAGAARAAEPVILRDVAVPMRDGVVLRADVLRPQTTGPFAVLVYRTPYDKKSSQESYTTFAHAVERGYAVVIQDVRGRYASAGEYAAYRHEGQDGFDTIEWAAKQPWSNGDVGTFGLSYPGAVQWLAAMESPPHLKAMAPAMTFATPRNFFLSGGVFDLSWISWIWNNIAPDTRVRKNLPGPRTGEEAEAEWVKRRDDFRRRLPLNALHELRDTAPYYFEWMEHPAADPWWDWAELRKGEADPRARLVMGPWVHGVGATKAEKAGDRAFGPAAAIDYDETLLRFMDRYLRGIDNGLDKEKRARVFVMGENAWHEGDGWPLAPTRRLTFFLSRDGAGPGRLVTEAPSVHGGATSFVSDPAKPVTDPFANSVGAHDYRELPKRADTASFETEPFDADVTVIGAMQAEICISADAPDTDLWVKAYDVAPDGTAFNLMSPGLDVQRASTRDGSLTPRLLKKGEVVVLEFANLYTGNRFLKGHRLRVVLTPEFFPHFSRNLHSGERETTSADMRKARITIHHDSRHPSRLVLPVLP